MTRFRLLLILSLIGLVSPCDAGTFQQTSGAASLTVRFDADGRKLALADLITVTLSVEGSPALDVYGAPLELGAQAKWMLVERSEEIKETVGPKRVRWQLVYRFAPREPGKEIVFAFPEVKFRDGAEHAVRWTPITFEVESQIATPDAGKLKGVAGIEEIPSIPPLDDSWFGWWLVPLLILMMAAAIAGLFPFWRRRRSRSPAQLALYEWQRLIGMKLPDKGNSERFITLLTVLVRRYLERQFALPARRQTTPEFLHALEACIALKAQEKQFLITFMNRCEAVKFAKDEISVAECKEWAEATRQFLQGRG